MKKLLLITLVIFVSISQILAQAPQSFKYQAVVRDGAGTVLANQMVGFQLSILQTSETGNVVYSETYTTTTNSYGLVNLLIGEGTPVSGDFTTIDWGADSYFLKVELDETGGTNYTHIGTSRLNSVPYALNAKTADNVFSGDYNDLSNAPDLSNYDTDVTDDFDGDYNSLSNKPTLIGDVTGDIDDNTVEKIQGKNVSINTPANGQVLKWNGTEWAPADDNTTGGSGVDGVVDGASFSGTIDKTLTLSRSNGLTPLTANFTDEVDDADNDATNELITNATLNGNNLEITDAGGTNTVDLSVFDNSGMNIDDADADPTNEIQILSISNDTIYLTNGGYVKLPAGFDGDYNSLSNTPTIPTNTSDLTNDSGFITNPDDADADPTNELITGATLNGTDLQITDAGGTKTVDLSSLDNSGTDSQTLSVSGTSLTISGGNTVTLQDNVDDADADPTNELQVLNFSNDTLYLSNGGQVYMGAYGNLWSTHGNDIYNSNSGYVGVGTDAPTGKFVVKGDSVNLDTALFEVRNAAGQPIFAVYDGGVRVWVDNTVNKDNNKKGGFAIGGYRLDKTETHELLMISPDSARIYYDNESTTGLEGGFAVESFEGTGGTDNGGTMHLSEENYFIGQHSGENITTGQYNSTFGFKTGESLTIGNNNVFLGYTAGDSTTTGSNNNFIGSQSGELNTTGNYNNYIGHLSGRANSSGSFNNFMGDQAGMNNTTGQSNVFIGDNAGMNNTTGSENICIGKDAGFLNTEGHENNFIGYQAGYNTTTGKWNDFIGYQAGYSNTTHQQSVAMGYLAGRNNDGDWNVFIGSNTGFNNTTGNSNAFVGIDAGYNNNGSYNTFLGPRAGHDATGSNNIFIGLNAGTAETNSNRLYIDVSTTTNTAPLIYGEFDNDIVGINGKLGVGTQAPAAKLHVSGTTDAGLTTNGLLLLGNVSNDNIVIDQNEILARSNGAKSILHLQADGGDLEINTFGSPSIFKDNGDVGIGTDAPSYKLHVIDNTPNNDAAAIYGIHNVTNNYGTGVKGVGGYYGVYGEASGGTSGSRYGVYGTASGGDNNYAGYFNGDVHISGVLSKSSGTFKIDDPRDPANKYLIHSFVESPEMKNVYDGVVVLDNDGKATVELPSYFGILNENFRYLLTAIGAPAPNIYISKEIANNQFEIAGGTPGQKISWQVTGVRKDPFAKQHPVIPELEKNDNEKGKYLNPELYGQPASKGIGYYEKR